MKKCVSVLITLAMALGLVSSAFAAESAEGLVQHLSSYSTGNTNADGGVAEIVKFNQENDCMYLVSGQTQTLDIVKVNADGSTALVKKIDVAALGAANGFSAGDITSVDVNTARDLVAIAVQNADYTANGAIVLLDYQGNFVTQYAAGIQPDMVTFTPDGSKVLTANEGEPREGYGEGATDPMGSVTVVDLDAKTAVTHDFTSLDGSRAALIRNGVLLKTGAAPSVDLEPEFIAVSADSKTAYVTLQENNAVGALDLTTGTWKYVKGLGFKDHSAEGNGLDLDVDGEIHIRNENVCGVYMPDGISVVTIGGQDYLITANEGDAREWGPEEDLYENIDAAALILSDGEEAGKKVEFLKNQETDGLEADKTYILGSRSFSIWKADTLEQVFDSGDDFEQITAAAFPDSFNSGHDEAGLDKRSHKKGVEPETVSVLETNGKVYAVVGLERMGGIMVYDITDPAHAVYADYLNVRDFAETDLALAGDLGPEGICTVPAKDSPTGNAMILVANEVSGTVTVAQMGQAGGLPFHDVAPDDWFYDGVAFVCQEGIMNGLTTTTFGPAVPTTRGMVVTMLWRMEGQPQAETEAPFADVKNGAYYAEAIAWAAEQGIVTGITGDTFAPDQAVTRQQLAVILHRYSQDAGYDVSAQGDLTAFGDGSKVSSYAVEAMEWAVGSGLIQGMGGDLVPNGSASRAQLATIFHRFVTSTAA